jgi:hypothetical protein
MRRGRGAARKDPKIFALLRFFSWILRDAAGFRRAADTVC